MTALYGLYSDKLENLDFIILKVCLSCALLIGWPCFVARDTHANVDTRTTLVSYLWPDLRHCFTTCFDLAKDKHEVVLMKPEWDSWKYTNVLSKQPNARL